MAKKDGSKDREECLYRIHNWYNESESKETIVPLHTMEKFIMKTYGANLNSFADPQNPKFKPFYHDFMETGAEARQFANKQSFMNQTRLSVRRVLGCGHFVLCILHATYNQLETKYDDFWDNVNFWRTKKKQLVEQKLLDPEQPCNSAAVFTWMQNFYRDLFLSAISMDQYWPNAKISFTMLRFTAPCQPDADTRSQQFLHNYQEFVAFLLHNFHEFGLLTGDPLLQYLRLVRKRGDPPAKQLNASQKDKVVSTYGEVL